MLENSKKIKIPKMFKSKNVKILVFEMALSIGIAFFRGDDRVSICGLISDPLRPFERKYIVYILIQKKISNICCVIPFSASETLIARHILIFFFPRCFRINDSNLQNQRQLSNEQSKLPSKNRSFYVEIRIYKVLEINTAMMHVVNISSRG